MSTAHHLDTSSECPNCKKVLDGATGLATEDGPSPGDSTICMYCGELMIYKDDMTLRAYTEEDMKVLRRDEEQFQYIMRVKTIIQTVHKENNP